MAARISHRITMVIRVLTRRGIASPTPSPPPPPPSALPPGGGAAREAAELGGRGGGLRHHGQLHSQGFPLQGRGGTNPDRLRRPTFSPPQFIPSGRPQPAVQGPDRAKAAGGRMDALREGLAQRASPSAYEGPSAAGVNSRL